MDIEAGGRSGSDHKQDITSAGIRGMTSLSVVMQTSIGDSGSVEEKQGVLLIVDQRRPSVRHGDPRATGNLIMGQN
jgi:hypothetical protein